MDRSKLPDKWEGSSKYWEKRYTNGGNSGSGSYGRLAEFKAETLNTFVKEHNIHSVIEWGCGDGNQLALAKYPNYTGFDVSKKAIQICRRKFRNDYSKKFIYSGGKKFKTSKQAELTLSLDVIYHLIEDDVYERYMEQLFTSSSEYVCIYSCNDEKPSSDEHVKHRCFTNWIEKHFPTEWVLTNVIPNRYPYDEKEEETSWSDFYFFKKSAKTNEQ